MEAGEGAPRRRRRRKRSNIIWYNLPWCNSVTTSIGRKFLALIDPPFGPSNPLSKIFNRRTIKISYSSMTNLSRIIAGHNSKILAGEAVVAPKRPWGNCSCPRRTREAQACPLGGECLEENIVYKATVKLEEGTAVE